MFNADQIKFIESISNKQYNLNFNEGIKDGKGLSEEHRNFKSLNFFMNTYNPRKDDKEQIILNYFLEKH